MRIFILLVVSCFLLEQISIAQTRREDIYSDFVFYNKRQRLEKDLRENIIAKAFSQILTKDNEHKFESACWAICQFQFRNATIEDGFTKMIASYDSLDYDTKRAFLEAVYAMYPIEYKEQVEAIIAKETHPKLFSICAVYLYRADHSIERSNSIKIRMVEQFPDYDSTDLLIELERFLNYQPAGKANSIPPLHDLIRYQKEMGNKIIYSFQRWNRDYPGLAIVQNADGSFVRRIRWKNHGV
jgi:hypothetical protein